MINKELALIVGAGNVSEAPEMLEAYSKDMSFVRPVRPDCVVKPRNAADVRKIVRLANETLTPLTPVSSGSPHFRGDTIPGVGGAVVVDLSGMKKIIRVDRPNRVAMCEPGVTFAELIAAAEAEGLRLNAPLAPRRSKSVVGSLLEREPVLHAEVSLGHFRPSGVRRSRFRHRGRLPDGGCGGAGHHRGAMAGGKRPEGVVRAFSGIISPAYPGGPGDDGDGHLGIHGMRDAPYHRGSFPRRLAET